MKKLNNKLIQLKKQNDKTQLKIWFAIIRPESVIEKCSKCEKGFAPLEDVMEENIYPRRVFNYVYKGYEFSKADRYFTKEEQKELFEVEEGEEIRAWSKKYARQGMHWKCFAEKHPSGKKHFEILEKRFDEGEEVGFAGWFEGTVCHNAIERRVS
jgi:hypothetical protein